MALSQVSAGGILFRRREDETELCLIRDDYGYWTFPKGKLEPGETPEQAALREVREEVEVAQTSIVAALGTNKYHFRIGENTVNKTVHWFLMEVAPGVECTPVRAERVQDAGWFPPETALSTVGYRNLRPVVRRALRILRSAP
jgi:8-oxo-dGTP pyrophosphatase MutT (NUDIX family)